MRPILLLALLIAFLASPEASQAQIQSEQFTPAPICSELINKTGFTVYGNVETDRVTLPDGQVAYHKSNFRLSKDETTQICARGPFFEGGKLILTLRSLLPVFECKTKLGQPITLTATPKDTIGYDWKATCYE